MTDYTLQKVVERIRDNIDLSESFLSDEYYYNSLTLCIIDSVFSIGVNYRSVQNTVRKYCNYYGLKIFRNREGKNYPNHDQQETVKSLIKKIDGLGINGFTKIVLQNRQRTSTQSGILKTEAVFRFAKTVADQKISTFKDIVNVKINKSLENKIREIPGQKSGVSFKYFLMLAGNCDLIKPDRMIIRYIENIIQEKLSEEKIMDLIKKAAEVFEKEFPNITPRSLDHEIWKFQRQQ